MGTALIGRALELRALQAGLDDALLGHGGLFLVGGEPGIGKTRLAEEVASRAAGRSAAVVWGRCWEGGGAPAYWPWLQIIRDYVRRCDRGLAATHLGEGARDLAQILPDLHEYVSGVSATPQLDPDDAQFRLFDAALTFFKNVAARQPLVLILDDLHAADPLSLRLLRFIAQELRVSAILAIATYREAEVRQTPGVRDLVADVLRVSRGFVLRGLDPAEVRELIVQALQGSDAGAAALSDDLVAAIHMATAGNPFFVDAIVRAALIDGDLANWGTAALARLRIPDQARAMLHQRLRLLAPSVVEVLRIAAVVGREFDARAIDLVRRDGVADGLVSRDELLLDHLSRAIDIGVITEVAGIPDRYAFTHPLMRETVYADISPLQRILLHRGIAEVLAALEGAPADGRIERIAHHFYQAAAHGCARQALDYAVRAAERAGTMLAYDDAVQHWEHALESLEIGGDDVAGERPLGVCRAELLLGLGNALNDAGDRSRAKEVLARAAVDARDAGAPELLARIALAFGGGWLGYAEMANMNEPGAVVREVSLGGMLTEALHALGETDNPLRARLLSLLARDGYFTMPMAEREALARQAIDAARRSGDLTALAEVLTETHVALWGPDSSHERLDLAREALHLAQQTGQPYYEAGPRFLCVVNLLEIGEPVAFEREATALTRFAERTRLIGAVWTDKVRAAMQALLTGRYDDAEWLIGDALQAGRRADLGAQIAYTVQTVALRREQGRLTELSEMAAVWKTMVAQRPRVTGLRAALAFFYAETGRLQEARAELEHLARHGFADLPRDQAFLVSLTQLTEVCAALDDPEHCASIYNLMQPFAHYNAADIFGAVCWGSVSRSLGLLATLLGRWADAQRHFETAIERSGAFGARPWVAYAQQAYASMLLRRATGDDTMRAVALLEEALASAEVLKATRLAEQARAVLQAVGAQTHDGERSSAVPHSTSRGLAEARELPNSFHHEGEYWTVAYAGTTVRLKDSRGLTFLVALLREPGREIAASELASVEQNGGAVPAGKVGAATRAATLPEGEIRRGLGDAGELLDAQARATYKQRLAELGEELEEAESFNDSGRSERLREEIEFLTAELSRAVGLGGRERRAGSHAERARVNVTRAISLALAKIDESHPALGEHFRRTIRTGTFCSYAPDPRAPIEWDT